MSNAEATTTENAAAVAEQGTRVAPEKASSKRGATQKKAALTSICGSPGRQGSR